MDHGGEAAVGFAGAHGDTLELFELAEEVFDEVAPLVELAVERQGWNAPWVLRDDDLGAARVEIGDDGVGVEGFISDQSAEHHIVEQRLDATVS